jgi:peptide chain release factor 3
VIDSVNGVEAQTRRLMEVCRMRDTPVIVFINKMDRDGKNRFDLLEEIENELHISLHPMTWPINSGKEFKGVYNIDNKSLSCLLQVQKQMKKIRSRSVICLIVCWMPK